MKIEELNDFSKQIYHSLYEYIPQLINQAEEQPESQGNFYLKIRSPIKEENIYFGIYTDADPDEKPENPTGEVSWEFDYYHSHSFGRIAKDAFEWLKQELDTFFGGNYFVGSRVEEGKWEGSSLLNKEELAEFLAGKFDNSEYLVFKIDQFIKQHQISESKKGKVINKYNHMGKLNRIVGWEKIYVK